MARGPHYPRKGRPPLELSVEQHLVCEVKKRGGWAVKGENTVGFPDRIVLAPSGRIMFVETKTIGGRVSAIQARIHRALRSLGHRVEVLWTRREVDRVVEDFFG